MKKTLISNPLGNITFSYIVNENYNSIGESSINYKGNINLYVITGTSIIYDENSSKSKAGTNICNNTNTSKVVIGIIKLRVANSDTSKSGDVYISLNGILGSGYKINKIYNNDYTSSQYNMNDWINIGTIPAMINNVDGYKDIEILISFSGTTPDLSTYLKISAYEIDSEYPIGNMPTIIITSVFSKLVTSTTVLNSDNTIAANVVNLIKGDSIYYLTTISNIGNSDANIGTIVSEEFMSGKFIINEVKYGPTLDNLISEEILTNTDGFKLTIPDTIPKMSGNIPGLYYVKVKVTVK